MLNQPATELQSDCGSTLVGLSSCLRRKAIIRRTSSAPARRRVASGRRSAGPPFQRHTPLQQMKSTEHSRQGDY
jgi:hypothetical protein